MSKTNPEGRAIRDLIVLVLVVGSIPFALTRPWLGVLFWVAVSIAAPQWNVWGFMREFPLAQVYAIVVFTSLILAREKLRFKWRPEVGFLLLLVACVNLSMLFAVNPEGAFRKWSITMKMFLLVLAAIYALNTRKHVELLTACLAITIGLFAAKGGLFTLATGGAYIVHGPNPTWENNGWAAATVVVIPFLVYFVMSVKARWLKWCLAATVVLATFSVLGSFSRGGFLALLAMYLFLWRKSKKKVLSIMLLLPLVAATVVFMPAKWDERMRTIESYQEDNSAMGRINAWKMLFNAANSRPLLGLGPYPYTPEVFERYAPNPEDIHSAHSMYFEVLGENGYPALLFFLLMWLYTWRDASWVIRTSVGRHDLKWAASLMAMVQASLIGHFVGGAFLENAYFEPVYYLLVIVVVVRDIVERQRITEGAPVKLAPGSSPMAASRAAESKRSV